MTYFWPTSRRTTIFLDLRIDDPIFGDAGASIISPLSIPVTIMAAGVPPNDLNNEVRPIPIAIQRASLVFACHENQVRFPEGPCPQPDAKRPKEAPPEITRFHKNVHVFRQKCENALMAGRRPRK